MLVTSEQERQILMQAREERWGLGAFNVFDILTGEAVISAAEELGVPCMIQIWDYHDPTAPEGNQGMSLFAAQCLMSLLRERARLSPIPVIVHLDHTPTYGGCLRGIQNGANSVMIDASQKPLDENVALTCKVVEAAHECGVLVEGEIGHVSGHSNSAGAIYTEVAAAKEYVERSGVDMCAVSIGTVHGFYASDPVLNYDRIAELREALDVPLVMHGSSGLTEEQFKKSIAAGIVKINFATYVQIVAGKAIADAAAASERPMFGGLTATGLAAAKEYIKKHMQIFGTRPVAL